MHRSPRTVRAALAALALAAFLAGDAAAGPFGSPCEDGGRPCGGPPNGHPGGPPPEAFLEQHAERLGLDDATRRSIRAIVDESRAEGEQLRKRLDEAHRELKRQLSAAEVEEGQVMRQVEKIGALELEEKKNRLRTMLRVRALLTPEQRKELMAIRDEMREAVHERITEACAADIESLCGSGLEHDEIRECLFRHRAELSETCRSALSARTFGHGPR